MLAGISSGATWATSWVPSASVADDKVHGYSDPGGQRRFRDTSPGGYGSNPGFSTPASSVDPRLARGTPFQIAGRVENRLGRVSRFRWGPREIDLDLLFHVDGLTMNEKDLVLPHPEMHNRFIRPGAHLNQVAPGWVHRSCTVVSAKWPSRSRVKTCSGSQPFGARDFQRVMLLSFKPGGLSPSCQAGGGLLMTTCLLFSSPAAARHQKYSPSQGHPPELGPGDQRRRDLLGTLRSPPGYRRSSPRFSSTPGRPSPSPTPTAISRGRTSSGLSLLQRGPATARGRCCLWIGTHHSVPGLQIPPISPLGQTYWDTIPMKVLRPQSAAFSSSSSAQPTRPTATLPRIQRQQDPYLRVHHRPYPRGPGFPSRARVSLACSPMKEPSGTLNRFPNAGKPTPGFSGITRPLAPREESRSTEAIQNFTWKRILCLDWR